MEEGDRLQVTLAQSVECTVGAVFVVAVYLSLCAVDPFNGEA